MIKFNSTKEETTLIIAIAKRAVQKVEGYSLMDCEMDLTATHLNGCPLDLEKLKNFDDFNFSHDIFGIRANINRNNGKLENCFLPRCSK